MGITTVRVFHGREDLPLCREATERAARGMGFVGDDLGDIVTAVFEACVNAYTHGRGGADETVTLTISTYPDRFEAIVKDSGTGFTCPDDTPVPHPASRRGRGIPLMKAFMDEVHFEYDNGCKVTLVKRLPASPDQ